MAKLSINGVNINLDDKLSRAAAQGGVVYLNRIGNMTYKVFTSGVAGQRQWQDTSAAIGHDVPVIKRIRSFYAVFIEEGSLDKNVFVIEASFQTGLFFKLSAAAGITSLVNSVRTAQDRSRTIRALSVAQSFGLTDAQGFYNPAYSAMPIVFIDINRNNNNPAPQLQEVIDRLNLKDLR